MKDDKVITVGTIDLSPTESLQTTGGNYWFLVGLAIYLYDNRTQFVQGLKDGIKDFK